MIRPMLTNAAVGLVCFTTAVKQPPVRTTGEAALRIAPRFQNAYRIDHRRQEGTHRRSASASSDAGAQEASDQNKEKASAIEDDQIRKLNIGAALQPTARCD